MPRSENPPHKLDSDENKNLSLTKHEFLEQMMVNYVNKD